MSNDKIAEIRARHEAGAPGEMPIVALAQADADREFLLGEIERLTRERDEARAWAAKLLATLEMVRDADNDCRVEGWATIPDAARRSIDEALEAKP